MFVTIWHLPLWAGQSLCFPHSSERCSLWLSLLLRNWEVWEVQEAVATQINYNGVSITLCLFLHERCESLIKVALWRRYVDDHEGFGVATQGVLHHLRGQKAWLRFGLPKMTTHKKPQSSPTTESIKFTVFLMITCVSLLFLYGTWGSSADKAEITSPRALRDLLMELASCWEMEHSRLLEISVILTVTCWASQNVICMHTFSWWSLAPVLAARSLPARSTRLSFPLLTLPLVWFLLSTMMPTIRWERELSTFISNDTFTN